MTFLNVTFYFTGMGEVQIEGGMLGKCEKSTDLLEFEPNSFQSKDGFSIKDKCLLLNVLSFIYSNVRIIHLLS
jgi:hypothetical protein